MKINKNTIKDYILEKRAKETRLFQDKQDEHERVKDIRYLIGKVTWNRKFRIISEFLISIKNYTN